MNSKIGIFIAAIVAIIIGIYFYLQTSEVPQTEEQVEMKQEKTEEKVALVEPAVVIEEKEIKIEPIKEEVVKKEPVIPEGFEEVSEEETQALQKNTINLDDYNEIYDYEDLNIYMDKILDASMKKSKKENLSLLIIKHITMGTVFIKKDEQDHIYLEVLEYKNFEQMQEKKKYAKSKHVYHFEFNKSQIKENENMELFFSDLDAAIKEGNPKNLVLVGYTDSRGTQEYNTFLSYKRAQVFSKRLSEYNIAVKYVLQGESNPVATNKTSEGRAQNRRVEMFLGL